MLLTTQEIPRAVVSLAKSYGNVKVMTYSFRASGWVCECLSLAKKALVVATCPSEETVTQLRMASSVWGEHEFRSGSNCHSKLYLFKNKTSYQGIVTSHNFTETPWVEHGYVVKLEEAKELYNNPSLWGNKEREEKSELSFDLETLNHNLDVSSLKLEAKLVKAINHKNFKLLDPWGQEFVNSILNNFVRKGKTLTPLQLSKTNGYLFQLS